MSGCDWSTYKAMRRHWQRYPPAHVSIAIFAGTANLQSQSPGNNDPLSGADGFPAETITRDEMDKMLKDNGLSL